MWLMLLPLLIYFCWCYMPKMADGIATSVSCDRCYYHLADVIAKGGMVGRCYSQCGRCNSHWVMFISI